MVQKYLFSYLERLSLKNQNTTKNYKRHHSKSLHRSKVGLGRYRSYYTDPGTIMKFTKNQIN